MGSSQPDSLARCRINSSIVDGEAEAGRKTSSTLDVAALIVDPNKPLLVAGEITAAVGAMFAGC